MAIGSSPEIGTKFTTWGQMDALARREWHRHMQETWGPDLVGGYAKIIYIDRNARTD